MKQKLLATRGLFAGLFLVLTLPVAAQPARVFGPPAAGHVRPPLWVNEGARVRPESTTSTAPPYTPQQVQAAYGFTQLYNGGTTGSGQTIALVDAYDDSQYIQSDLNTFDSQFGLPPATVQVIYAQGTKPSANSGWQQEMSLDVQWAHAIAPGATILLVEASDSSTAHLLQAVQVAVNHHATVVSMSWGGGEFSGETTDDSYFTAAGVTFVASAGDSGESSGVEWPAASPNVLGVGGTTLTLNSSGAYGSETAWSSSGGGLSGYEKPQPAWQNGWFQSAWTPVNRGVPDVSYLANPNDGVYVVYKGVWYEFGGTSVGAPQWSALVALANQGRTAALSGADAAIYSFANGGGTTSYGGYDINAAYFHDITSGNNGNDQDDYAYSGYDLVTGVGTPAAASLVPALNAWGSAPPSPDFALAVSPGSQTVAPGGAASYTVTVSAIGGYTGAVNLSVSGLPTGAGAGNFNSTQVTVPGSATLSISIGSAPPGAYTLTISGSAVAGTLAHSVNATLVVANTMTVSMISYSTSGRRNSNLNVTLTVTDDIGNPVANASVAITLDFNGSAYAAGTATTGSNGEVTLTLQNAPAGTYSTVVTSVTASDFTWDGKYPSNSYTDPH